MSTERETEPSHVAPDGLLFAAMAPPGADGDLSIRGLVGASLRVSVATILASDPIVRLADDPEGVHQARVATRRLRSDLRFFAPVLDVGWARGLRAELARYALELGLARDADVLLDVMIAAAATLPPRDEPEAERLVGWLRRERGDIQDELLAAMRSRRYRSMLDDLVSASLNPAVAPEVAARDARTLGTLMDRPWAHLEQAHHDPGGDPSDADLHAIRIRAKRARYAAEALVPVFGKPARRFARAAAELQTVLGRHHDAVMASAWLREAAARAGVGTAFVAGELAATEQAIARERRDDWRETWARLERRKLRFWR
ncbi:MAG: CHAD domain-containing protein [Actinomycetota bacterium]